MNCDAIDELLSDYIDGELAEETSATVRAHIAGCERCAGAYRALRRTVRFVQNVGETTIAGDPGRWYSDFTRALVDESSRRTPIDVLREMASNDIARNIGEQTEGDTR